MRPKITHLTALKKHRFSKLVLRLFPPPFSFKNITFVHDYLPAYSELPAVCHKRTSELVYCLGGPVTAVLNGKKFTLKKGHILWIPPGVWHQFKTGAKSVESLSFFQPAFDLKKPDVMTPSRKKIK